MISVLHSARNGSGNMPGSNNNVYPKVSGATLTLKGSDKSPLNIAYRIDSKVNGNDYQLKDSKYSDNRSESRRLDGEQEFYVSDIVFMDRSGNTRKLSKTSNIYMDVTPPNNKIDNPPQVTITATSAVTNRTPDGRDLYNHSVDLHLSITEPNEGTRSAGLKSVEYTVKVNGNTVRTGGKKDYEMLNATVAGNIGQNASIVYSWDETVHIDAGGEYESNNIG